MHACKGRHVLQLHHGILLPHHYVTNLQGPQNPLFKDAAGAHHVMLTLVAFGYAQRNGLTGFLEIKRVVAHGQITNLQEPVAKGAGLHLIAHHGSQAHLKQAVAFALGGVIQWPGHGHLDGVAGGRVDHCGLCNTPVAVLRNLPTIRCAITVGDIDPLDIRQGAKAYAPGLIALEAHAVRALEIAMLKLHAHRAIGLHLAVLAQDIEHIAISQSREVYVLQLECFINLVEGKGSLVGQILFFACS